MRVICSVIVRDAMYDEVPYYYSYNHAASAEWGFDIVSCSYRCRISCTLFLSQEYTCPGQASSYQELFALDCKCVIAEILSGACFNGKWPLLAIKA